LIDIHLRKWDYVIMKIVDISVEKIRLGKFLTELPEIYELRGVIENNCWHNHETTFDHTLKVLTNYKKFLEKADSKVVICLNKKIDRLPVKDLIFASILLHDLGKKETIVNYEDGSSFFPLHEEISAVKSKKILDKLDFSCSEKKYILNIIKNHSHLHSIVDEENKKLSDQFNQLIVKKPVFIFGLVVMVMMDITDSYLKQTMPRKYQFLIDFYRQRLKTLTS